MKKLAIHNTSGVSLLKRYNFDAISGKYGGGMRQSPSEEGEFCRYEDVLEMVVFMKKELLTNRPVDMKEIKKVQGIIDARALRKLNEDLEVFFKIIHASKIGDVLLAAQDKIMVEVEDNESKEFTTELNRLRKEVDALYEDIDNG